MTGEKAQICQRGLNRGARPGKAFLVTGTDTGIGKTYVACLLARAFREAGLRVGVFKPVETGVSPISTRGDGLDEEAWNDAILLREASGCHLPPGVITPYSFGEPSSPWAASRKEGVSVSFDLLKHCFEEIARSHDVTVVETAGGLLVPVSHEGTWGDLALLLKLPLLVVVGLRLGAVNHALLTFESARQKGLEILGYLLNEYQMDCSAGARTVEETLKEFAFPPLLGCISHGESMSQKMSEIAGRAYAAGEASDCRASISGSFLSQWSSNAFCS